MNEEVCELGLLLESQQFNHVSSFHLEFDKTVMLVGLS